MMLLLACLFALLFVIPYFAAVLLMLYTLWRFMKS